MSSRLALLAVLVAILLWPAVSTPAMAQQQGLVFDSSWDTGVGTSRDAVTDSGRWPDYWEFNRNTSAQLLSVVANGVRGHHALRVEQRGSTLAANLQLDDFIAPSHDYYLRYYMKNEDTSRSGDHVVTVDTFQYSNLTFMRKFGSPTGWTFVSSFYGCGYTYPIGHWGPSRKLSNGAWYRFEYYVHFVDATHVQVHPRVYDAAGTLIVSDDDFRQSNFGSAAWNGRSDWTLASYYAADQTFCVQPEFMNDLGLGNNGQQGAISTGLAWYFSAVEIRTDRWPGEVRPAGGAGGTGTDDTLSGGYPGDASIERDPGVVFVERFDEPALTDAFRNWTDVRNVSTMTLSSDVPWRAEGHSLEIPLRGGGAGGGYLYKELLPGIDDVLYVRYYVKYSLRGTYLSAGVWMGGLNPPLPSPDLRDGIRPDGQDRFAAAVERNWSTSHLDTVDYWTGMRVAADGRSVANVPLDSPAAQIRADVWTCVEQMVRLNGIDASDGAHEIWVNGVKVAAFEGVRWRTAASLNLNWIWLVTNAAGNPPDSTASILFDHIVAARRRIGCLTHP